MKKCFDCGNEDLEVSYDDSVYRVLCEECGNC